MLGCCNKRVGCGALGGAGSSGCTGRGTAAGVGNFNTADVGGSTGGGGGCCRVAVPCLDVILSCCGALLEADLSGFFSSCADCGASRVCSLLVVVAAGGYCLVGTLLCKKDWLTNTGGRHHLAIQCGAPAGQCGYHLSVPSIAKSFRL